MRPERSDANDRIYAAKHIRFQPVLKEVVHSGSLLHWGNILEMGAYQDA